MNKEVKKKSSPLKILFCLTASLICSCSSVDLAKDKSSPSAESSIAKTKKTETKKKSAKISAIKIGISDYIVRTTAYTHNEKDHLAYRKMNAIGSKLKYGKIRSAASDWSVFPLGTEFKIAGLPHTYVIDDYGSALVGTGTIDLYRPSRKSMNAWGLRYIPIKIVKWGDYEKSKKILSGRTKYKHCRKMYQALVKKLSGKGLNVKLLHEPIKKDKDS